MQKSVIKPIIGGILFGTFVFFTGPLLFIVLLLKFIFTPFGMGRMMVANQFGQMGMPPFAFAEKIRSMNDDEFSALKDKMQNRFSGKCGYQNC